MLGELFVWLYDHYFNLSLEKQNIQAKKFFLPCFWCSFRIQVAPGKHPPKNAYTRSYIANKKWIYKIKIISPSNLLMKHFTFSVADFPAAFFYLRHGRHEQIQVQLQINWVRQPTTFSMTNTHKYKYKYRQIQIEMLREATVVTA